MNAGSCCIVSNINILEILPPNVANQFTSFLSYTELVKPTRLSRVQIKNKPFAVWVTAAMITLKKKMRTCWKTHFNWRPLKQFELTWNVEAVREKNYAEHRGVFTVCTPEITFPSVVHSVCYCGWGWLPVFNVDYAKKKTLVVVFHLFWNCRFQFQFSAEVLKYYSKRATKIFSTTQSIKFEFGLFI